MLTLVPQKIQSAWQHLMQKRGLLNKPGWKKGGKKERGWHRGR